MIIAKNKFYANGGFSQIRSHIGSTTVLPDNKNNHFEMILNVGIGEKRKETRFQESVKSSSYTNIRKSVIVHIYICTSENHLFRCRLCTITDFLLLV